MGPIDRESVPAEEHPAIGPTEVPSEDDPIAVHQEWIRSLDDAARRAYSALGISSLVIPLVLVVLLPPRLFSLGGLGLLAGLVLLTLIVGRVVGLARYEARLRQRALVQCRERDVEVGPLLDILVQSERYEFFVKLFERYQT